MKKTATSNNIKSKDKIFEEVFSEFKKAFNKTVDKEVSKLIETTNYLKKSKNTEYMYEVDLSDILGEREPEGYIE